MSERSGTLADDPFSGRHPTSHERLTGLPWDASYHDGPAPWDIGQPQPAIVRLASEGGFAGAVLDAGCGTGENALHVASLGLSGPPQLTVGVGLDRKVEKGREQLIVQTLWQAVRPNLTDELKTLDFLVMTERIAAQVETVGGRIYQRL